MEISAIGDTLERSQLARNNAVQEEGANTSRHMSQESTERNKLSREIAAQQGTDQQIAQINCEFDASQSSPHLKELGEILDVQTSAFIAEQSRILDLLA